MILVIDTSAVVALLLNEPLGPIDRSALLTAFDTERMTAPALFSYEVPNALLVAMRRGRIDAPALAVALQDAECLGVELDAAPSWPVARATVELADAHAMTVYDAAYIELAVRLEAGLVTLDTRMRAAARRLGLDLFDEMPRYGQV